MHINKYILFMFICWCLTQYKYCLLHRYGTSKGTYKFVWDLSFWHWHILILQSSGVWWH